MGGVLPKIFQNTLVLLNKKYVVQDRIIIIKCNIHPTFGVLYKKAPQTPQMGCNWGAKTSPPQDVKYFDFLPQKCGILLQFTPIVWHFTTVYHKSVLNLPAPRHLGTSAP